MPSVGRASPYYGKLGAQRLDPEILRIWRTRDEDLPELPTGGWSWELQTDPDVPVRQDFARRLVAMTQLTEAEERVIELCVLGRATLRDVADEMGKTPERVRQILNKALRRFRQQQYALTGVVLRPGDCEDESYRAWKWRREGLMRR